MLLRHATPIRNVPSILRQGLLCSKSRGRLKVVWLHSAGKSPWAALHVVRRHGGRVEEVVVFELDVPRAWLRRSRSRSRLWYSVQDIPPARFRRIIRFAALATCQPAA
jgi:hypothetical protein